MTMNLFGAGAVVARRLALPLAAAAWVPIGSAQLLMQPEPQLDCDRLEHGGDPLESPCDLDVTSLLQTQFLVRNFDSEGSSRARSALPPLHLSGPSEHSGIIVPMNQDRQPLHLQYSGNKQPPPGAPQMTKRLDSTMIDVDLALDMKKSDNVYMMNPALLPVHTDRGLELLIAVRHHEVARGSLVPLVDQEHLNLDRRSAENAKMTRLTWHNKIFVGRVTVDRAAWRAWPTTGIAPFSLDRPLTEWPVEWHAMKWATSCSINSELWDEERGTLIRWEMDGPEDAKLFVTHQPGAEPRVSLLFSSFPPDACFWSGPVPVQMYLAADAFPLSSSKPQGERLSCQSHDHSEKNWIPFTHNEALHFISTLNPRTVIRAAAGEHPACEQIYSEEDPLLTALSVKRNGTFLKGTGSAIFINSPSQTANLPRPHYLGLLHYSVDESSPYSYATHAFRFEPDPPFRVLQLSDPLPLIEKMAPEEQGPGVFDTPFAWVSGLSVFDGTVVISYGAGDQESRALVLTLERLDQFFSHS